MKKVTASILLGLIFAVCFATYSSASVADSVKEEVLRLHILANSDSVEDQALKLKVRDAVLKEADYIFLETLSKEEAMERAVMSLSELKEIAEREIRKNGYDYSVKVSITQSFFPTRVYENGYRLPAGYYDALKIEIGQAKGKNWWCILYPPLCLGGSISKEDKMEEILCGENLEFVTADCGADTEVRFKLAEIWGQLINKLSKLN